MSIMVRIRAIVFDVGGTLIYPADPKRLAQSFTGLHHTCYDSVSAAWQKLQTADSTSVILITGSLFLVGEMLALRHGIAEEYQLNERLEKFAAIR